MHSSRVIVYCRKKEQCCELFELFKNSLGLKGYKDGIGGDDRTRLFAMFHSKTSQPVKDSVVKSFLNPNGHIRAVFCTVAFGMGVDVKAVTNVVHVGPSNSLEDYLQESGRIGRGGEPSHALLITYPHATSGNISSEMKDYRKSWVCRRKLLLSNFGFRDIIIQPKDSCCDICARDCECSNCGYGDQVVTSKFEKVIKETLSGVSNTDLPSVRSITSEQRVTIQNRLIEYRNDLTDDLSLFHEVDISTGFTRSLIDLVVKNLEVISGPHELESNFNFFSQEHVVQTWNIIYEVLENGNNFHNQMLDSSGDSDSDIYIISRKFRKQPVLDISDSE
ncbi:MAG: helicase-related protein [Candidatus Thiodiazotropha sp.]